MIARPAVDLPQPDSPTTPKVSPGATVKLIPDTGVNGLPLADVEFDDQVLDRQGRVPPSQAFWYPPMQSSDHLLHRERQARCGSAGLLVGDQCRCAFRGVDRVVARERVAFGCVVPRSAGSQGRVAGQAVVLGVTAGGRRSGNR